MIETIELNSEHKLDANGGVGEDLLKQRKPIKSDSESNGVANGKQNGVHGAAVGESDKEYVWEWEFDWWLIFYLITIHVCGVYGIYCLFLSKWQTILFSKLLTDN